MSLRLVPSAACFALALTAAGCDKKSEAAIPNAKETAVALTPQRECTHSACADSFFVDTVPAGECIAGGTCTVVVKLVATGDYHINDEYPYRFKADEESGIEFLGGDSGGKNVFSKTAGDWQRSDAKSGAMSVKFKLAGKGSKKVGGTLKLSVCSVQNCLVDQRQVIATVVAL
jgi:hypothetical protein